LSGCGQGQALQSSTGGGGAGAVQTLTTTITRVTKRPANPFGDVLVLMYHKFGVKETRYSRSFDHFAEDLERLYQMGFRPVTMGQYLANEMPLSSGASPVVITMDDAADSQFQLLDDGSVSPDCAVGIWQSFAADHPDFPVRGTFYVLPGIMWGQRPWRDRKVELLKQWGSELASHTWDHPVLRNLSDEKVEEEIAKSLDFLRDYGFDNPSFAYPYGVYPKNMKIMDGFWWHDHSYVLTGAVTCDPDLAPSPNAGGFKPFKVPRIEAEEGSVGVDYWLDRIERGHRHVFVAP
jgi:hypothetical protein